MMRSFARLTVVCGILFLTGEVAADVTATSPYPYDDPPAPGVERGTFAFNGFAAAGPDCIAAVVGTAKFLPNADLSGGKICVKFNVDLRGTGALCASAPLIEGELGVLSATYTYNGDGTLCERAKFSIGPFKNVESMFHDSVAPDGSWVLVTNADIAYACPDALPPSDVNVTADGISVRPIGTVTSLRIGAHGDDPPGSGELPCELPQDEP
ncbi:MAG: hypothetical protein ACREQY_09005 [Candidatus Binatia bacterium]